jgi:hypothetical protein
MILVEEFVCLLMGRHYIAERGSISTPKGRFNHLMVHNIFLIQCYTHYYTQCHTGNHRQSPAMTADNHRSPPITAKNRNIQDFAILSGLFLSLVPSYDGIV